MTAPIARSLSVFVATIGVALIASPVQAGGCAYGSNCYRQVATPPLYDTYTEQRLVRAPRTVYRTTPPVYGSVTQQVQVGGGRKWVQRRDASGRLVGCWVDVPPRYTTVTRQILVRPASVEPETLPPVYANYSNRVMVQRPGTAWVPAAGSADAFTVGSIPDKFGITGASSSDIGVGLGFSDGSIYEGY